MKVCSGRIGWLDCKQMKTYLAEGWLIRLQKIFEVETRFAKKRGLMQIIVLQDRLSC